MNGWSRFQAVATERGEAPAFIADDGATSFAGLRRLSLGWADQPEARRLRPGQRVVIWSENCAAMAAAVLGTWSRGAVPVVLGPLTPLRHVAHAVSTTDAALLAVADADVARARASCPGREVAPLQVLLGKTVAPPSPLPGGGPGSIIFTSGSTGLPKGVIQSHGTLLSCTGTVAGTLGLSRDDLILCAVPWSFDYGWGQLLATLLLGVAQAIPAGPAPLQLCDAIGRFRPTVLAGTTSVLAGLIQGVSGIERADLASVRLVTSTGSAVPRSLLAEVRGRFGSAAVSLNYGLTETYRTTSLDPALLDIHPGSVGRAIPGVTLEIVDDAGRPVPPGTTGEVVHIGAGAFEGYWGDPEATAAVRCDRGGPAVRTGDVGRLDDSGLLTLFGRRDRQLKSMGVRVSPEEIETILMESGLLREAAVLSQPHDVIGDLVLAAIVPKSPCDQIVDSLKRHARRHMSAAMLPRRYEVLDALPRTSNGKTDYVRLERTYAGTRDARLLLAGGS